MTSNTIKYETITHSPINTLYIFHNASHSVDDCVCIDFADGSMVSALPTGC